MSPDPIGAVKRQRESTPPLSDQKGKEEFRRVNFSAGASRSGMNQGRPVKEMKGDAGSKEMKEWWKQTSNEIPTTTTQVLGSRLSSNEAAINSEEDKLSSSSSAFLTIKRLTVDKGKESIAVKAVVTIRRDMRGNVVEKIEDRWEHFINGLGRGISLQLVSEEIDPGSLGCRWCLCRKRFGLGFGELGSGFEGDGEVVTAVVRRRISRKLTVYID
ncbi:hypothetical protein LINPERPRIM_LOCUS27394 [Linum perenne]